MITHLPSSETNIQQGIDHYGRPCCCLLCPLLLFVRVFFSISAISICSEHSRAMGCRIGDTGPGRNGCRPSKPPCPIGKVYAARAQTPWSAPHSQRRPPFPRGGGGLDLPHRIECGKTHTLREKSSVTLSLNNSYFCFFSTSAVFFISCGQDDITAWPEICEFLILVAPCKKRPISSAGQGALGSGVGRR